ncbi:MAG: hypothetical protein JXA99_06875 [Candidatus Lokiarchaeota archaeon]|nr:hypothetical protein [Candidatus Lokiarchaeota archaeon]
MTQNKEEIQRELECYTKIVNLFSNIDKDPNIIELHKDKTIIKIMNSLKKPENEDWLKNALIILLSLFDDTPADLYNNLGINGKKVSKKEKKIIFSKIKEEFLSKEKNGISNK